MCQLVQGCFEGNAMAMRSCHLTELLHKLISLMSSPLAAPRIAKTFVKLRHTAFQSKDKYFGENWLCMLVLCEHYSLNLVFYNAPFNVTHEPPPPSPFPQSTRGVLKEDKFGCQNPSLISRSESLTHFTVRIPHSFHSEFLTHFTVRIPHSFHC